MSEFDDLLPSDDAPRVHPANRLDGSVRGNIVAGFAVLVLMTAALFMIVAVVKGPIDSPSAPLDGAEPEAALIWVRSSG